MENLKEKKTELLKKEKELKSVVKDFSKDIDDYNTSLLYTSYSDVNDAISNIIGKIVCVKYKEIYSDNNYILGCVIFTNLENKDLYIIVYDPDYIFGEFSVHKKRSSFDYKILCDIESILSDEEILYNDSKTLKERIDDLYNDMFFSLYSDYRIYD